ncbi:MAG: DNA adenine methylase, partial [Chitinophagaceae bacterium]
KYVQRLEQTQIFCRDALNVIKNTDHKDSFFFVDPPYYNADMGSYDGYTLEDFTKLLDLLQCIKGKFLLTAYPSEILAKYAKKNQWKTINNRMHLSASAKAGRDKIEVFTMKY